MHELDCYITQAFSDWGIPGGSVAVVRNGDRVLVKGYGLCEAGKPDPVDGEALFAIGSCSKAFTAAAVGILIDDGKLDWDDKIVDHLPDFQLWDPWITREATLRDALTHRMGNMRVQRLLFKEDVFDADDMIRRMRSFRPVKPFRTTCHYNNPGFVVAGKVIEAVSGLTWRQLVEQRLFQPLGMAHSYASYGACLAHGPANIATQHGLPPLVGGYVPGLLRWREPVAAKPWADLGENAAGSILSNAPDCLTWLEMLLHQGQHQGRQVLSPEVVRELLRSQIVVRVEDDEDVGPIFAHMGVTEFAAYGLGWYVCNYRGRHMAVHGGDAAGHSALMILLPEEQSAVAMLVNTQTWGHAFVSMYLADWLLGEERDHSRAGLAMWAQLEQQARLRAQQDVAGRDPGIAPSLPLAAYAGTYTSPIFGDITISFQAGGWLRYQHGGGSYSRAPLEHWQGDTFLIQYQNMVAEPEFISFAIGADGTVQAIEFKSSDPPADRFFRAG